MNKNSLVKIYSGELHIFLLLWIYIVLRIIFVPPLHDEVATFFHYIETGNILNNNTIVDANNHLLNSFLSRFSYLIFGEHFWAYRLSNFLAFSVYFWSIVGILKTLKSRIVYWVVLIALNSIPFLIEYFAMSRGYGLGMSFMLLALNFLIKWIKHEKYLFLIICLAAAWLSVFANLIFINSFLLLIFYLVVVLITHNDRLKSSVIKFNILIIGGATIAFIPLVMFAFFLKNAGALYYGSLDGFWEVTGKSLSSHVFFIANDVIKWALILSISGIVIWGLRFLFIHKWKKTIRSPHILSSYFFIGNVIITLILAIVFNVNYPEDRAGIHFVFFFILSLAFIMDNLSIQYVSLGFLFFPVSLLFNLNLSRTVVTPDQTLSRDFYNEIRRGLTAEERVQVYPTQSLIWAYYERSQETKVLVNVRRTVDTMMQTVVTRKPFYVPLQHEEFEEVGYDPLTADYILKNKREWKMVHVSSALFDGRYGVGQHLILDHEIQQDHPISIKIKSRVKTEEKNDVTLEIMGYNQGGERIYFSYFPMRWYYGQDAKSYKYEFDTALSSFNGSLSNVKIFLINRSENDIYIEQSAIELDLLKPIIEK
jgi:hypothetical protein